MPTAPTRSTLVPKRLKPRGGPFSNTLSLTWAVLIISSTFFFTASRLKEAGSCIGGYSIAVSASFSTYCWTWTKRQNSRAKKSFM